MDKKHHRSAVIIIDKNKILLMRRVEDGREYFVFPGGTIEENETPKETAIREIKEETNLDIEIERLLWKFEDEFHVGYYFLAKSFKGEIELGGPEAKMHCDENFFCPDWVKLDKLDNMKLFPEEIKNKIKLEFL
ncbi:MAG: NUDIX domain-containing protein [Candidatus Woesearchaeota archaeon]